MNLNEENEDFQFRPLTEGLGFHKRSIELKKEVKEAGLVRSEMTQIPERVPQSLMPDFQSRVTSDLKASKSQTAHSKGSLGGDESVPETSVSHSKSPIIPYSQRMQKLDFAQRDTQSLGAGALARSSQLDEIAQVERKKINFSFEAAILDSIVILAVNISLLIAVLLSTQVDLNRSLFEVVDLRAWAALYAQLVAAVFIYTLLCRVFFGYTLGEWAFDIQAGEQKSVGSASYTGRVFLRSLLQVATGFVFFPILSLIFRIDLLGKITGLYIQEQE